MVAVVAEEVLPFLSPSRRRPLLITAIAAVFLEVVVMG
jgi:hypothetical protein